MAQGLSVAAQILAPDEGEPLLGGSAPKSGQRGWNYFYAGKLLDGSPVWLNIRSVRQFLAREELFYAGREQEGLTYWQKRARILARAPGCFSEEEIREMIPIFDRYPDAHFMQLLELYQQVMGKGDVADHLKTVSFLQRKRQCTFDDAVKAYIVYFNYTKKNKFDFSEWLVIFSYADQFPEKSFECVVKDYVQIDAFAKKLKVCPHTLLGERSVFVEYARAYDLSADEVIAYYKEGQCLERRVRLVKRTSDELTSEDFVKIVIYARKGAAMRRGEGAIEKMSQGDIRPPRPVLLWEDRFLIFFNRSGRMQPREQKDVPLGQGADVLVKEAFDSESGEMVAVTIQPYDDKAKWMSRLFQITHDIGRENQGFAFLRGWFVWESKSGWDAEKREWRRGPEAEGLEHRKLGTLMTHYESNLNLQMGRLQKAPFQKRLTMALQLVEAVEFLHDAKGYIHRDLKPDNLFLDAEDRIRIGDMRRMMPKAKVQVCPAGAPWYQPPEYSYHYRRLVASMELAGDGALENRRGCSETTTPALDMWAVGMILWELFKNEIDGQKAFGKMSWIEYIHVQKLWREDMQADTHFIQLHPQAHPIAQIVWHCLHPDPQLRFTATQARENVETLLLIYSKAAR